MLLFALWIKAAERAERAVILNSGADLLGNVVANLKVRGKLKSFLLIFAFDRFADGRIEG